MTPDPAVVRAVLREVLAELRPDLVAPSPAPATGRAPASVPQVPAPPVAAVLRPSTWRGTGIESATSSPPPTDAPVVETVSIATDADLDAFVHRLLRLAESPRDRRALDAGKLRFALRPATAAAGATGASTAPVQRVERGAVTERLVREAAAAGSRLVLAPGAVLTPMGRDAARRLGVAIERERRC